MTISEHDLPDWLRGLELEGPTAGAGLHDADRLAAVGRLRAEVDVVQPLVEDLLARTAEAIDAPVVLLNVVLTHALVVAGAHGLGGWLAEARATPVEWSLCGTVVRSGQAYVVPDLAADPATRDLPICVLDGMHAYAGVPLRDVDGHVLGALCALDTTARTFTERDLEVLRSAASEAARRLQA